MGKRVSLQRLLTTSVLSIGLFTGAVGLAYAYWHAKESLRATIGISFQELARQSADKVALVVDKEVEWVERLASMPEVIQAVKTGRSVALHSPAYQRWSDNQLRNFGSIVLLDRNGRSVGGITSDTTKSHYGRQSWWSVVFEQQRSWISELQANETGHGYWEVAVPIMNHERDVIGAIKVVVEKEQLLASVFRSRIGSSGHVMLFNDKGQVLACPVLPPAQHRSVLVKAGALFDATGSIGEARWLEVLVDSHGAAGGILGIAPVTPRSDVTSPERWYIVVRQNPSETYAPLMVLMRRLAAFGLAAVCVGAVLRWRLALRIVEPVKRLVRRMKEFGQAAPPAVAGPMEHVGIAELDDLSASFDDLAGRLAAATIEREQYVADLERANQELATSEEHYRMLWNHSLHIRLLVDREGRITAFNRRGEIKLSRPASDVLGTSVLSLFADADRARLLSLLNQAFTAGKECTAAELNVPAPAGDAFIMDADFVPVEKNGEVDAVMVQLTDLTEKKQLQQQLLRSERLASLSQFASMFAHDIRNPLVGLKKTLELLSDCKEVEPGVPGRWYDDMRFTIELLLGMINDMLDVYQESYSGLPLLKTSVSLQALADEVTRLFRSEAEASRISFRLEVPACTVRVQADGRRLLRVLINLVHNALKFSPPGGLITVTVREERKAGPALPEVEPAAVTVQVADEGPGIAAEDLPHLFELFFRKRDPGDIRTGRGLGLHFCRLVMEAHGGRISAENRPAGGAVFSLLLPAHEEAYAGQSADCRGPAFV